MSGIDERKATQLPRCPHCEGFRDIVIEYSGGAIAGWVLHEEEVSRLGVSIVLSDTFSSERTPVLGYCLTCGDRHRGFSIEAVKFFNKRMQANSYITWVEYTRGI